MSRAAVGTMSLVGTGAPTRIAFLDHIRYLMIVLVVLYHAVAAYAVVAPHWPIHDSSSLAADVVRELLDVFAMPVLFFAAGYFAIHSLARTGVWGFLRNKVTRLLIPWALFVLVVIPLVMYGKVADPVRPFWRYWLWYMGSFETRLRFTQAPQGPTTQMVYWFISLLFAFFVLAALVYALTSRWRSRGDVIALPKAISGGSTLLTLVLFGTLTGAVYFVSLLLVPDTSWFTLSVLLEFQVTRLVFYAGYFGLGVYAHSRGWFAGGKQLGSLVPWGAISAALAAVYLVVGWSLFTDPARAPNLPVGVLLAFAFSRSFLLVALLVVLVSGGARYWNRSSGLDRQLSKASYSIYLTHFWAVMPIQEALLAWTGGPVVAKVAIVFLAALGLSFAISRWVVGRYPRAVTLAVLGLFVLALAIRP